MMPPNRNANDAVWSADGQWLFWLSDSARCERGQRALRSRSRSTAAIASFPRRLRTGELELTAIAEMSPPPSPKTGRRRPGAEEPTGGLDDLRVASPDHGRLPDARHAASPGRRPSPESSVPSPPAPAHRGSLGCRSSSASAAAGPPSTPTWQTCSTSLAGLLLAPAKRLRPAFCHWGFVGAGGDPDDPPTIAWSMPGAAFELLHAFALFHDDVMDGSAVRRGDRTCHLELRRPPRGRRLARRGPAVRRGRRDPRRRPRLRLRRPAHAPRRPPAAWAVWNELRIELNVGQYLDILGTAGASANRPTAERIARYKSGKYTVERPLHLGALLAAPTGDELVPAAVGLRPAPRRRVPAPRRHARRVRRRPPSRASPSATTSARASRRRCSRWRRPGRRRRSAAAAAPAWARLISTPHEVRRHPGRARRHRRGQPSSKQRSPCSSRRRWRAIGGGADHRPRRASGLIDLAYDVGLARSG